MQTCSKCHGYGLVRWTFECHHCHGKTCYLCENVNKLWTECEACTLYHKTQKNTKKNNLKININLN